MPLLPQRDMHSLINDGTENLVFSRLVPNQ